MFLDARTVPERSTVEADVCIVGAGAAGITLARALRQRALRVVLLESGGFTPDSETQALAVGASEGRGYFPLDAARTRCFGGTTAQWNGECRPLAALDFERRDWVPDSGWPFGLAALLPYYETAQEICGLGPFAYRAEDWRTAGVRPIAFDGRRVVSDAFHYSAPLRFGEVYRDDVGTASDVVAYLGANVVELETPAPPTLVSAARAVCLTGRTFRVRARTFVLAAGGIENARLLLLSNTAQPGGLGNGHDLVGRYFAEHLYMNQAATLAAADGAVSDFYTTGHGQDGRRVRGILTLSAETQRAERLTNFSAVLDDAEPTPAPLLRAIARAVRQRRLPVGGLVRRLRRAVVVPSAAPSVRRYDVKNVMEQAPNRDSRVVLTDERDRLGCARVALRWTLSALDKRTMHRAHEIVDEELRRAGVGRLQSALGALDDPWPATIRGARHHIGTTRMHPDPRRGVVDADGRVHGLHNLYVAGSSVFPTGGSANPTLTIVALALRLAEHLRQRLGHP